jgi:hypothetical protein
MNEPQPEPEPAPKDQLPKDDSAPHKHSGNKDSSDNEDASESKNISTGTLISPFIFRNKTISVAETEQLPQDGDFLEINVILASFHYLDRMRLYILSGNKSMAMNETAVFDFSANLTMVQARGFDRQTFSLTTLRC